MDLAYASTALRKGQQLLKYCRRGKPHACHVQLSPDECEVQWVSGAGKQRTLRLAAVRDVVAGQTTAVFRRACSRRRAARRRALTPDACEADDSRARTAKAPPSPCCTAARAASARWTLSARCGRSVACALRLRGLARALMCVLAMQDEEQLQLWLHGLRGSLTKLRSAALGSAVSSSAQAAARAATAVQRWKTARACACAATARRATPAAADARWTPLPCAERKPEAVHASSRAAAGWRPGWRSRVWRARPAAPAAAAARRGVSLGPPRGLFVWRGQHVGAAPAFRHEPRACRACGAASERAAALRRAGRRHGQPRVDARRTAVQGRPGVHLGPV